MSIVSNVKSFKMNSGEEVVAEVLSRTLNGEAIVAYHVRRPHILQFQPVAPGQMGLALVPWTLANPEIERLEMPASAVMLEYEPSDRTARQYLQQTSGIAIPNA